MALDPDVLAAELENLTPTDSEAAAITRLVGAFSAYFDGATVLGAPLVPGSTAAGANLMSVTMVGISGVDQGALKLASGISAFWAAQAPLATSMWITAPTVLVPPIVVPAGLPGLEAALTATFASNTASNLSLEDAAAAVAATIHAACLGGTVPGSVPPAPPVPIPIL